MKEAKLQGVNTRQGLGLLVAVLRQGHPRRPRDRGSLRVDLVPAVRRDEVEQDAGELREVHGRLEKADGFATQAWGAGVLLRDIVNNITEAGGNNAVTRAAVLKEAANITDFDADGMLAPRDAGAEIPSPCYVLTQVKGGKFVRVFPKKAGTFQCDEKAQYTIKLDLIGMIERPRGRGRRVSSITDRVRSRQHRSTWSRRSPSRSSIVYVVSSVVGGTARHVGLVRCSRSWWG